MDPVNVNICCTKCMFLNSFKWDWMNIHEAVFNKEFRTTDVYSLSCTEVYERVKKSSDHTDELHCLGITV